MDAFPPDQEVPSADVPVPASTVALSLVSTELSVSIAPWADPPLATAFRVACFEGSDTAALQRVKARCDRELGDIPGVIVMPMEVQDRRYTSATMATIAYDRALARHSRADHPEVLLWPCRRTPAWWDLGPLQRQAMFLPRLDPQGKVLAPGHVQLSEPIVPLVHRRLYHESLPQGVPGVMLGWFETAGRDLAALRGVVRDLQDKNLAPDHAFYQSGPLWWGRRVAPNSLSAELS